MTGGEAFELFVNGTLMRGLALHNNLRGATFLAEVHTEPRYRLHSIGNAHPGMYEVEVGGVAVVGEVYLVPPEVWTHVESGEPENLYLGIVHLQDLEPCQGMLYPRHLAEGAHLDISHFGGWRQFTQQMRH